MVLIIDSTKPQEAIANVILTAGSSNYDLLAAMAGSLENGRLTTRDAIAATLAEVLLEEDRPDDIGLVLPTTSVVERTIKPSTIVTTPPDSLIGLRAALLKAADPHTQADLGLQLGDKALLMHAGRVGSRTMGDNKHTQQYAMGMAYTGYETAINTRRSNPRTSNTADSIVLILNNFEKISRLLRRLFSKSAPSPHSLSLKI